MSQEDCLATAAELKDQLVANLESSGVLDDIRSQLRLSVFKSLQGENKSAKPQLSNRQILTSSIISEWLITNGFQATVSTLNAETGLLDSHLPKTLINNEFGISNTDPKVPILDIIVAEKIANKKFTCKENIPVFTQDDEALDDATIIIKK